MAIRISQSLIDLCSKYGIWLPERNNTFWEEFLHERAERILKNHYDDISFLAILNVIIVFITIHLEYETTVNSLADRIGLHAILKPIFSFIVFLILTVLSYLKWKLVAVFLTPEYIDESMHGVMLFILWLALFRVLLSDELAEDDDELAEDDDELAEDDDELAEDDGME